MSVIAIVAATAAVAAPATAGPPGAGTLVLGTSLGGARLGMTVAQLEKTWGRAYGRCRGCARPTLYFNLFAFRPEHFELAEYYPQPPLRAKLPVTV